MRRVGGGYTSSMTSLPGGPPDLRSRFLGCLLGGAVGDALGAPVEFLDLDAIRDRFGPGGVTDYAPAYGREGAITDDTQMTLFTAEGLIRASNREARYGTVSMAAVLHHAYLRWLHTQGEDVSLLQGTAVPDGWLVGVAALHAARAPGNSCLSALRSGRTGTVDSPINDSKGCGGAMRVAPVGLVADDAFRTGCEVAAVTHGHPTGFLAAGAFARIIAGVCRGESIKAASDEARTELSTWANYHQTTGAIGGARTLVAARAVTPDRLESLGRGWVAEEALAIALACALSADDFASGVLLAVNHSGDSDSTGCMTGQLLGTVLGVEAIPATWLDRLELRDVIESVADDLYRAFEEAGARDADGLFAPDRYPPA